MIVELKKTKITASIMKQIKTASLTDLKKGEVLGWCIHNNREWIVLYHQEINKLSKFLRFKETKIEESYFKINIVFSDSSYTPGVFTLSDMEEVIRVEEILNNIKLQASVKGQFYL